MSNSTPYYVVGSGSSTGSSTGSSSASSTGTLVVGSGLSDGKVSITIDYAQPTVSTIDDCPLTKIEVFEDQPLLIGSYIYVNAVSSDPSIISSLRLWQGTANLGAPTLVKALETEFTETLTFNGDSVVDLNWPVISIKEAFALPGHIYKKVEDVISLEYLSGDKVATFHGGGSCLRIAPKPPPHNTIAKEKEAYLNSLSKALANNIYYGGIIVTAERAEKYGQWIWKVTGPGIFSFFLKNTQESILHYFQVTVDVGQSLQGDPEPVTIKALNSVTNVPVADAEVFVDAKLKGTTDSGGILSLGLMNPGIYSLKIVHPSYITTDVDEIENDSFVIGTVSS